MGTWARVLTPLPLLRSWCHVVQAEWRRHSLQHAQVAQVVARVGPLSHLSHWKPMEGSGPAQPVREVLGAGHSTRITTRVIIVPLVRGDARTKSEPASIMLKGGRMRSTLSLAIASLCSLKDINIFQEVCVCVCQNEKGTEQLQAWLA